MNQETITLQVQTDEGVSQEGILRATYTIIRNIHEASEFRVGASNMLTYGSAVTLSSTESLTVNWGITGSFSAGTYSEPISFTTSDYVTSLSSALDSIIAAWSHGLQMIANPTIAGSQPRPFFSGRKMSNLQRLELEKAAFTRMKDDLLHNSRYYGKYVAILDGKVIDCDGELAILAKRVYAKKGYIPIYMTKVAPEIEKFENSSPETPTA